MKLLIFLSIISIVASFDSSLDSEWENFKTSYGKNYITLVEHDQRRQNWEDNNRKVQQHNLEYFRGAHTYNLSMNKFSDMDSIEFVRTMNGYKSAKKVATEAVSRESMLGSPPTLSTNCCTSGCATTSPYFVPNTMYYLDMGDTRFFVYLNGTIKLKLGLPVGIYTTLLQTYSTNKTLSSTIFVNVTVNCLAATTPAPISSTITTHAAVTTTPAATTTTTHATTTTSSTIPTSVDWRLQGYVTAVKDQGQCGACWSFSTTGALEGQHFKKTGTLVSLSEQQLVDCNYNCGTSNCGCSGGLPEYAFQYIVTNKGIDTEASYPYTATDPSYGDICKYATANLGATVASNNTYSAGYVSVTSGSEAALLSAVTTIGPISVAMDASDPTFQSYASGVYGPSTCSNSIYSLDHAVLVVGYGHDSVTKLDYWLVKNSWSTSWGIAGYFWLARNQNNMCGIATDALYPLV